MLKQTFIAAATSLAIAAGSLGATTTTASASGATFSLHIGNGYNNGYHHDYRHARNCYPVVKKIKRWTRHGWRVKVVRDYRCRPHHRHHRRHWDWR